MKWTRNRFYRWLTLVALAYCGTLTAQEEEKGNVDELNSDLVYGTQGTHSGVILGGFTKFGQARPSEGNNGTFMLFGGEVGYQMQRTSWGRFEASLLLGNGQMKFSADKEDGGTIKFPISMATIARFGYAYSIGKSTYGVFRLGVGPVLASYEAKPDGVSIEGDADGILFGVSYGVLLAGSDTVDFYGDLNYSVVELNVDNIDNGADAPSSSYRTALTSLVVGLRVKI